MKAQINLFLKDDNSYKGIFDGTPIDFAMMLHKMGRHSVENKSAIYIATAALLKDDGDSEMVKAIWAKIEEMNPEP
jgi:hypothetical protein